jgi:hypothetical protein
MYTGTYRGHLDRRKKLVTKRDGETVHLLANLDFFALDGSEDVFCHCTYVGTAVDELVGGLGRCLYNDLPGSISVSSLRISSHLTILRGLI